QQRGVALRQADRGAVQRRPRCAAAPHRRLRRHRGDVDPAFCQRGRDRCRPPVQRGGVGGQRLGGGGRRSPQGGFQGGQGQLVHPQRSGQRVASQGRHQLGRTQQQ